MFDPHPFSQFVLLNLSKMTPFQARLTVAEKHHQNRDTILVDISLTNK